MTFFNGLYFYEVVLLVLGVILFVVLLIVLLRQSSKGQPLGTVGGLFLIPVLMIGYPSITKFQYNDGVITIEKKTQELIKDPTNASLRESLRIDVAKIARRPTTDPQSSTTVAKAQFALGEDKAAETNLHKALNIDPNLPAAQQLNKKIEATRELESLTTRVQANPNDSAAKAKIQRNLAELTSSGLANPQALAVAAQAHEAVGEHAQAAATADKALAINPNQPAMRVLRNQATTNPPHP